MRFGFGRTSFFNVFHREDISINKAYKKAWCLYLAQTKLKRNLFLFLVLLALFSVLLQENLQERARCSRLKSNTVMSDGFRQMQLSEPMLKMLEGLPVEKRGTAAGIYYLEKKDSDKKNLKKAQNMWAKRPAWGEYLDICNAIWNDVTYFPVPVSSKHESYSVSFVDSCMGERTYGGKRGHEGTDIMASQNTPGLYPVVSMTDGTVVSKGWLEKGGWRLGISAPSGGYFYYAHLDSYADIEEGDTVRAGEVIGFMGNSGYGPEGTTGVFATHLHVGIYIYPQGEEISVNPYWVFRLLEEKKLSCSF